MESCKNCDATLQPSFAYCPSCGQKARLHRLSLHDVTHEGIHYFTHADKGLFLLLQALATKTGLVAREYMSDKRRKYFPPLNFFLICAAVYLFMGTLNLPATQDLAPTSYPEHILSIADPAERASQMGYFDRRWQAQRFMDRNSNYMSMLSLPVIAFVYFVFYRKNRYNFTEHLVANMFMSGFTLLVYAITVMPFAHLLDWPGWVGAVILIPFQLVYFTHFYIRFLDKQGFAAKFKAGFVSFTSLALWSMLTSFLIGIYILNGFWGLLT